MMIPSMVPHWRSCSINIHLSHGLIHGPFRVGIAYSPSPRSKVSMSRLANPASDEDGLPSKTQRTPARQRAYSRADRYIGFTPRSSVRTPNETQDQRLRELEMIIACSQIYAQGWSAVRCQHLVRSSGASHQRPYSLSAAKTREGRAPL
jgi:hypothetical protein